MMSYNTRKLKNLKQQCFILTVDYVRKIVLNSLLFFEIMSIIWLKYHVVYNFKYCNL